MIYAIEVNSNKDRLLIINDLWEFLEVYNICSDMDFDFFDSGLDVIGDMMAFDNMDRFKEWLEEELDADPIFLVIDTTEKKIFYVEADPSVKITVLKGNATHEDIEKERKKKFEEARKRELEWEASKAERTKEFLINERKRLEEKVLSIDKDLKEVEEELAEKNTEKTETESNE